ncbi:MAG TPA: tRNA (adenosine(37)-N6)-dimethylallyltransferase MiaA [Burkholderiaceae bacterium]|nr:tRNA (adenosine(37)-N6)-dimethylallyltransferase MiaA [Burkholderiaceae bacterium]
MRHAQARRADAVLLLGPTATGKSRLALDLARRIPLEIVSVDSALVYRGMDIGTAKPGIAERAKVPHHLIDIRDPADAYSAAEFERDARRLVGEISARGRLPLLVGGTMLYAKALREGLARLPSADPQVRRELEAEAARHGWPTLHARLARIDPATAQRLAPNDAQRIQRALEVHRLSGATLSQHLAGTDRSATADDARRPRFRAIALVPPDRGVLHRLIEQRFDAMLAAGFLDEVRALVKRGDLDPDLPSQRSVGYRQAWQHIAAATPLAEFRAAAIAATRRLAKRQMTWLRSLPVEATVDPFDPAVLERLATLVLEAVG